MSIEFEAPLGQRIMRDRFYGVTTFIKGMWWCHEQRKWVPYEKVGKLSYSSHAPCRSVKAFLRMLRKNPHIASDAVLCSWYHGHNVFSRSQPHDQPRGDNERS